MSAEIKGLKTIYHTKDEAFITRGYRSWRHATENFRLHEESDVIKIMSISYPLLNQFVMLMKALMKHQFAKRPGIGKYL